MFETDKKEKQKIKAIELISRVKDINVLKQKYGFSDSEIREFQKINQESKKEIKKVQVSKSKKISKYKIKKT